MPLEITVTNEQKVSVSLKPITLTGKPASLDGVPVWSVVGGEATVVASPDGLSASLVSSDNAGDTIFRVMADAHLSPDQVEEVQDTILLHVTGANAANLGLVAGTPEAK